MVAWELHLHCRMADCCAVQGEAAKAQEHLQEAATLAGKLATLGSLVRGLDLYHTCGC